jgi:hypothetical protein
LPSCSLFIASPDPDEEWELVQQSLPLRDAEGFYWEFETDLVPQQKWKLDWGFANRVAASKLTVSGQLYIPSKPTVPVPRAQLAIYPTNLIPEDESLCRLAIVSVDNFQIPVRPSGELFKDDIREIVNRDYEPIANWLTQSWDDQLIKLWGEVKNFTPRYLAPPTLLRASYEGLEVYGIDVNTSPPPYSPPPLIAPATDLVSASVSLFPPLPENTSLVRANVSFFTQPGSPAITQLTLEVVDP